MADYAFSSAGRKKKKSPKKIVGESSDSHDALPTGPAHESSSRQSTITSLEEGSRENISTFAQPESYGGSKVKEYIASLNNSTWPPPTVSSSRGVEDETYTGHRSSGMTGKAAPSGKAESNLIGYNNGPKPIKTTASSSAKQFMSSKDSESDSGSSPSDDSELASIKIIDKYKKKYLDNDDGDNYNQKKGDEGKLNLPDKDVNGNTYDKYRQRLSEMKGSEDKWGVPTKKLGAAPSIDYNYRYSLVSKGPSNEEKPKSFVPALDTKPKPEKVMLKSSKIDKDDLGILASMLGVDDSASESTSHGIFSTSSVDEGAHFLDAGSSRDGSEAYDEVSIDSSESTDEGEDDDDDDDVSAESTDEGGEIGELIDERADEIPLTGAGDLSATSDSFSKSKPQLHVPRNEVFAALKENSMREDEVKDDLGKRLEDQADMSGLEGGDEKYSVKETKSQVTGKLKEATAIKDKEQGLPNAIIPQETPLHQDREEKDLGDPCKNRADSVRLAKIKSESSDCEKISEDGYSIPPEGSKDSSGSLDSLRQPKSQVQRKLAKLSAIKASERMRSDAGVPPDTSIRDDAAHELGNFLDNRIDSDRNVEDKSERPDADDFSSVWERSVASEAKSRARAGPSGDDDSQKNTVLDSQYIEEVIEDSGSEYIEEEIDDSSESTVEASNSTSSKYDSSGGIGSSVQLDISDHFASEVIPPTSISSNGNPMQYEESSSESESEGSLDFDNLTGLEKYTMQDSKNSSRMLVTEIPVMSNRKLTKNVDSPEKRQDKQTKSKDNQKAMMVASKEDSDGSLDAFELARPPPKKREKKTSPPKEEDESGSMSDYSLNPSKDLLDEISQSEYDKPEYHRQGKEVAGDLDFNEAFHTLDASSFIDVEAPTSEGSRSVSKKSHDGKMKADSSLRKPIFSTGYVRHIGRAWVTLAFFAAIGLPIYFFVFLENDDGNGQALPPLGLFPAQPTLAPTLAPVATPTAAPVPMPSPPTPSTSTLGPTLQQSTASPTSPPSRSRISILREFLVSVWPSLEEDFVGFGTPQYLALDWLANNGYYDEYSDDQKIQRFALATLFYSTRGDFWRRNTLWLSNEDECDWYSGSPESPCDENGSYSRLKLDLNNLSGTIPAEVGLLSNLSLIDLSRASSSASLSSTIPSEVGLLVNLVSLNLRGNDLTGSLPTELGNCVNITSLDISINRLSGNIPTQIAALIQLQSLNLASNSISNLIPSALGSLTRLQSLNLDNNLLSGGIPSEIGFLSLLSTVNLDGNGLTSLPTQIGNLLSLKHFSAANNQLQGPLPSEIGGLEQLLSMQLGNNLLNGTIPSTLGKLIELRDTLDLSSNQFSGQLPTEIGQLIFLRTIALQSNQLTGGVPDSFSSLVRLGILRLESNSLTGIVSDTVCTVFNQTYPVFAADCANPAEIVCPCCMYCCQDFGNCTCQFTNTDLDFLCTEFSRSPGLETRISAN